MVPPAYTYTQAVSLMDVSFLSVRGASPSDDDSDARPSNVDADGDVYRAHRSTGPVLTEREGGIEEWDR